jgi:hypothetical protein
MKNYIRVNKAFTPLSNGFNFQNKFMGFPVLLDKFPRINSLISRLARNNCYGLCGGMCFAVLDYYYSGKEIPSASFPPKQGTNLHAYLSKRQNDTYGFWGKIIVKFVCWSIKTDFQLQERIYKEFLTTLHFLDKDQPVVLGIVYVHISKTIAIWMNHQVIAYRYENNLENSTIFLYDPNFPGRDDIVIEFFKTNNEYQCFQKSRQSGKVLAIRGFFVIPYSSIEPPDVEAIPYDDE